MSDRAGAVFVAVVFDLIARVIFLMFIWFLGEFLAWLIFAPDWIFCVWVILWTSKTVVGWLEMRQRIRAKVQLCASGHIPRTWRG